MPRHEYRPETALAMLLNKIGSRDARLAAQIQEAVDAGTDISESEPSFNRRKRSHIYRKKVAYSPEQALEVALNALQAHFVEQPLLIDSAQDNFAKAHIGMPEGQSAGPPYRLSSSYDRSKAVSLTRFNEAKTIEIEIQTETQFAKVGRETMPLETVSNQSILQQRANLEKLRSLTDFKTS